MTFSSEVQSQEALTKCLNIFNFCCIFYRYGDYPELLKFLFSEASKSGNKHGTPDRIYYNEKENILIIMECKRINLNEASSEYLHYLNCVNKKLTQLNKKLVIYGIAFVDKNKYKIFHHETEMKNAKISLETFNLKIKESSKAMLEREIHKIHNYIRDFTKISNEEKPFVIACCLLFLKNRNNGKIFETLENDIDLYNFIKMSLESHQIETSVFDFLKTERGDFLRKIIEMLNDGIFKMCYSTDLLNLFYSEFVKYQNTDGKSLGIVLTPDHIVKLMVEMIDINERDVILDISTGTGSFLLEASKYNPKGLIGIEYQPKLFQLLKINFILRDLDYTQLKQSNCFDETLLATKSIINPPYGMKDKTEMDFIIKQLVSISEGGLAISIIPINALNNKEKRNEILKTSRVKWVVACNPQLFYPTGASGFILLLEKCKDGHNFQKDLVKFSDYTDDGIENKRNVGKVKTDRFDELSTSAFENPITKLIDNETEWWFYKKTTELNYSDLERSVDLIELEIEYNKQKEEILNKTYDQIETKHLTFKTFKITDLFTILKKPNENYTKTQQVNLIGALKYNNGLKGFIQSNQFTFTGNKIVLVTGGDGGAGMAYYQQDDFNITSTTIVLSPKFNLTKRDGIIYASILSQFKSKYSFNHQWSQKRIQQDSIELPIDTHGNINLNLFFNNCNG